MEAIGLEVINTYSRQNKQVRSSSDGDKGSFLGELSKMFSTVQFNEVQKSYRADNSWFKKNPFEVSMSGIESEDEDGLSALYKEYKKILLKLYRMKREIKES